MRRTIVNASWSHGISAAVTVVCLTNTKACFGSCPTFYAPEGERMVLQAEGFSDSIAPSLERRDVDALFRTRPTGRDLQLRLTNEALETHVIKEANLAAGGDGGHAARFEEGSGGGGSGAGGGTRYVSTPVSAAIPSRNG